MAVIFLNTHVERSPIVNIGTQSLWKRWKTEGQKGPFKAVKSRQGFPYRTYPIDDSSLSFPLFQAAKVSQESQGRSTSSNEGSDTEDSFKNLRPEVLSGIKHYNAAWFKVHLTVNPFLIFWSLKSSCNRL